MNLSQMRGEVQARGFSHVPPALIDRWINDAYQDVNDRFPWPFLFASASGTSPLTIADLAHVLMVTDTTNSAPLKYADIRDLLEGDPKLISTGASEVWYLVGGATVQIATYPTSTATYTVRYIKVPTDLTADADIPLAPVRFHDIYIEMACARCYRRANETEGANDCIGVAENEISKMQSALLVPNYDSTRSISMEIDAFVSTDW